MCYLGFWLDMSGATPNIQGAVESPLALLKEALLGSVTLYNDLQYKYLISPEIEGFSSAGPVISKCSTAASKLANNPADSV